MYIKNVRNAFHLYIIKLLDFILYSKEKQKTFSRITFIWIKSQKLNDTLKYHFYVQFSNKISKII